MAISTTITTPAYNNSEDPSEAVDVELDTSDDEPLGGVTVPGRFSTGTVVLKVSCFDEYPVPLKTSRLTTRLAVKLLRVKLEGIGR
jgi:hypothetical protein